MSADPPPTNQSNGPSMPLGFMLAGSELATFTVIGLGLDYYLGTMPGFTIGLTLIGVPMSFYHLMLMAKKLTANKKAKPPDKTSGSGS